MIQLRHLFRNLAGALSLFERDDRNALLITCNEGRIATGYEGFKISPRIPVGIPEAVSVVLDTVPVQINVFIRNDLVHLIQRPLVVEHHVVQLVCGALVKLHVQILIQHGDMNLTEDVDEIVAGQKILIVIHQAKILHALLVPDR